MSDQTPGPEPGTPEEALDDLLGSVTRSLQATRVLLWETRLDEDRVVPVRGPEPHPPAADATDGPLPRTLRVGAPRPVEPTPPWARGSLVAARVDPTRLITIESANRIDPVAVREAARTLAPVLRLYDQHTLAVAAADRADQLADLLRSLQANATMGRLPDVLLQTALTIADANGGVVASWIGHEGTVLAVAGRQGGPPIGTTFPMGEADLARAARTGAAVYRDPDGDGWPVLASESERWDPPGPTYRTVLPLIEPGGMTTGMLALWSNRPLAVQGVSLLEALAPLLATQMRAAAELDLLRAGATVDAITGLPNRRALETRLADEQARFDRYRRPVSLVVIELDDLDRITDSLGPDTRDAVLRIIAAAVRATVREVDYPARYGASRLAVLLPETVRDPALDVAERVRQAAAAPFEYEGQHLQVAVSVGVSACPETVDAPADLIVSAEEALQASMKG